MVVYFSHEHTTKLIKLGQPKLDFTCCDVEPAVIGRSSLVKEPEADKDLARNVLILSAILEEEGESNGPLIWEIYYHIFLSTPASELLQAHIKRLLLMTESLDGWHKSTLGSCIRLVNEDTLRQLRGFWARYCTESVPEKREVQIAMEEFRRTKCPDYVVTSARSAGPFFIQALETAPILHKQFWEKGVIWGGGEEAIHTNPTMIVTGVRGTQFAVHYGTEPALPFHLAPAFAELSSSDPLYRPSLGSSSTSNERASRVAGIARSQFSMWSSSFRQSALKSTTYLRIRFVICNALSLCSALAERRLMLGSAPGYARQWTFSPMLLDPRDYPQKQQIDKSAAPTSFNVIDTSNLTDHVGLLNLLVSTIPCLERGPNSSLFIESLLHDSGGESQVETFSRLLLADQTAMFVLLGVAPVSYLTGVSAQSTAMDSMRAAIGEHNPTTGQIQRRSQWKLSDQGDPRNPCFRMRAQELAKFLFIIYLEMFSVEGLGAYQDLNISKISRLAVIHYTRSSFAQFVLFLSSRISVDWRMTIDLLMNRIIADRSLVVGMSNIQDLYVQFHRHGLYTIETLASPPRELASGLPSIRASGPGILAQHSVSAIVCVNLIVPRESLDVLTSLDNATLGTPALRAEITGTTGNGWQNFFSTVQMSFGSVITRNTTSIVIREDLQGWKGRASMVVSFLAPAWMLLLDSDDSIKISLEIQSTPATSRLIPSFGIQLKIFEATLGEQDHVVITEQLPGITAPILSRAVMVEQADLKHINNGVLIIGPEILLQSDCRTFDTMIFRLELQEETLKTKLAVKMTSSSRSGRIFGLCHPQKGGIYTLILVSSIRLDLSAHTVVADAHVLPLSQSVLRCITRFIQDHQKDVRTLLVSDEGVKMWSSVLAVSVERCREGIWEHQKVCEYKKVGKFPTSTTPGVLSLCSCGKGKASSSFISCKAYETLIPYVHRAAIGLIFAVPFYEQLFMGAA